MKKRISLLLILTMVLTIMTGCGEMINTENTETSEKETTGYIASFYTNSGDKWFMTTGEKLDIKTNKVKDYSLTSNGEWVYNYEVSSILSIYIDNHQVDACGSTILFADNSLQECDIKFKGKENIGTNPEVSSDKNLSLEDYIRIRFWWNDKKLHGQNTGQKLIVIQSQLGDPITMYMGDNVSWTTGDLPKTTLINIDGKYLYVHRSNFAIIDTDLIEAMPIEEMTDENISVENVENK